MSSDDNPWIAVIGKALALLCMKQELGDAQTTDKAIFLHSIGVPNEEITAMLGTTPASVRNMLRKTKNKSRKGPPRGK